MPPATWKFGHPWGPRTPPGAPQGSQRPPSPRTQARNPYMGLRPGGGDSSSIGTGVTGPDVAGPMTADQRSTVGMVSNPVGYGINAGMTASGAREGLEDTFGTTIGGIVAGAPAGIAKTALGAVVPGLGPAALAMGYPLALEKVLGWFGLMPEEQVPITATAVERQGLSDKYGYDMPTPYGESPSPGLAGVDMDSMAGIGGIDQAPGDQRDQTGEAGGATGGASDTAGTADSTGGSRGGSDGPDYARGGVSRVTRPTRARYGEGGEPETAIFIPESMKKPGRQGRESQVLQGLLSTLRMLNGRERR